MDIVKIRVCILFRKIKRTCQMKKRVFILLSSWERKLIGKAGPRNSCHVGNIRVIKKYSNNKGFMLQVNKIPTQDEYGDALKAGTDLDKKVIKVGELHELDYKA